MRIRPVQSVVFPCMALSLAAAGCNTVPGVEYAKVQRELLNTQEQVRKLKEEVAAKDQVIQMMKVDQARRLGLKPEELEQLIVPVKIELERLSGGYDDDGKPGDDGIVLYVQPIDRNGDVIKAAGSLTVTLLDLANPPEQYLLGEYRFDVKTTRGLWYGRLWSSHFTVHCPWYQGKPPMHNEITARVEFLDLLTGQKLTAQGVYKIQFPPGHVAGSAQ